MAEVVQDVSEKDGGIIEYTRGHIRRVGVGALVLAGLASTAACNENGGIGNVPIHTEKVYCKDYEPVGQTASNYMYMTTAWLGTYGKVINIHNIARKRMIGRL